MNPEGVQLFIIICLCFPFFIPFLKRVGKLILIFQIVFSLLFLSFAFFQRELFPIHITFGGWQQLKGIEIVFSYETLLFLITTNLVFLAVTIASSAKKREWRFYFLLSLLITDITCLFMANDLFNIYVTLELLSLLSYLLISIELKKRQIFSSLKYMILGAVGFNLYLIGTSIIYGEVGTLNLTLLSSANYRNDFALMMIMVPLLIKSEVFFFSMWVPSAQSESDTCVSTLLSAIVVNAGLFHVLRITNTINSSTIIHFLTVFGLSTAFFGALFSTFQRDIKMILAFLTMSHVGFVLIGLSKGGVEYACSHSLYKSLLFLSIGYYYHLYHSKNGANERKSVPFSLYVAFLIGFFSLSGMPFFVGSSFKNLILSNTNSLISIVLKFISALSIFGLCRILFLFKPSKNIISVPFFDFGIILLGALSVILGSLNTLKQFSFYNFTEALLILIISILVYQLLHKRIPLSYPYKFFKLSSSLALFSIIIGIIMSLSIIGISLF